MSVSLSVGMKESCIFARRRFQVPVDGMGGEVWRGWLDGGDAVVAIDGKLMSLCAPQFGIVARPSACIFAWITACPMCHKKAL